MNGIWISLDGCGGSGKTTFFERLKQIFPEFVYVPEFSSLCTGTALEKMIKAAAYLTGEHDYASFCSNPKMKKSTVRIVDKIDIHTFHFLIILISWVSDMLFQHIQNASYH